MSVRRVVVDLESRSIPDAVRFSTAVWGWTC